VASTPTGPVQSRAGAPAGVGRERLRQPGGQSEVTSPVGVQTGQDLERPGGVTGAEAHGDVDVGRCRGPAVGEQDGVAGETGEDREHG
jgi:hypothetical protein